ncbi:MAG: hypothetical protein IKG27_06145 [Bacilli bacterium]|nr:hypothetical protein [Bacilli bacterium]
MKEYQIDLKLILSSKFLQSGKNKKEIRDKVTNVIIEALKNDKTLKILFNNEIPVYIMDISENE